MRWQENVEQTLTGQLRFYKNKNRGNLCQN
jgi:hypothetical protein